MRLIKFNEQLNIDYIRECFITLYDDERLQYEEHFNNNHWTIRLNFINIPTLEQDANSIESNNINGILEYCKDLTSLFQNIYECIEKVKLNYGDVNDRIKIDEYRYIWINFNLNT